MRICASPHGARDMAKAAEADMVEIRMDLFDSVPDTQGLETIVTFREGFNPSVLPEGFDGYVDVGMDVPPAGYRTICSVHDYEGTPDADAIRKTLDSMESDIAKGAYAVRGFRDLASILGASKAVRGNYLLIGMGEFGKITRIRSDLLGNPFTFAHVGEPTAPGQMGLDEMRALGDRFMVTGIVGNPLSKSRSPAMHAAAFKNAGMRGIYLKFETDSLDGMAECVRGYGIRGLNVTIPHKTAVIGHLDSLDAGAETAGAVNTVVNDSGTLVGYNTDVHGIEMAFARAGREISGGMLVMGYGGSARAAVAAGLENGCDVTIVGRDDSKSKALADELGVSHAPNGVCMSGFNMVVNCTPIGMYGDGDYPADVSGLTFRHSVLDLVYGVRTPLWRIATAKGCVIASGENVLAAQGAKSFELWTGVEDAFKAMKGAI